MPRKSKGSESVNRNTRRQRRKDPSRKPNQISRSESVTPSTLNRRTSIHSGERVSPGINEHQTATPLASTHHRLHSIENHQRTGPSSPLLYKEIQRIGILGTIIFAVLIGLNIVI